MRKLSRMKELTLYFQPATQDYIKAFRAIYWQKTWVVTIGTVLLMLLAVSFFSAIVYFFDIKILPPSLFIYLLVLNLLFGAIFFYPFSLVRVVNNSAALGSETSYHFRRDGRILYNTITGETTFDKNHFSGAVWGKDHIALIHRSNERMFQMIPRRAFESAEQETGLRDWLQFNNTEFQFN